MKWDSAMSPADKSDIEGRPSLFLLIVKTIDIS